MRQTRTGQVSIFDRFSNHDIGEELKAMSARLDRHRELLEWVVLDLHLKDVYDTGRQGLPAESVLRCALLKQYRQLSYQELTFHLSDSASFQAFARLPGHLFPKKSVLQQTISPYGANIRTIRMILFSGNILGVSWSSESVFTCLHGN